IEDATDDARSFNCDGRRVLISGFSGHTFSIFDVAGRRIASFLVDTDDYIFDFGQHTGAFVISSDNISTKVIIR
ncbi:MAG: hypothetical protein K2M12_03565, partial [Muribaculaceae bacterium]|nr:hypothetical protein [Muribaculaceae bacterium]